MPLIRLLVFVIATVPILMFSWPSLQRPRSHGFFRFFAFESILLLVLINSGRWFFRPFSFLQLFSWPMLIFSLFLAAYSLYMLRHAGRPRDGLEDTTIMVHHGAYRFLRHPLYASLWWLAWGAFLKSPTLLALTLTLMASLFVYATARVEEQENLQKFGQDYARYMQQTKMFIPFIF